MSGTVALGHALVATGAVLVFVSAALDGAVHDGRTTRRVGRVVLAVAGFLAHPLVALHRRLGESPAARCTRRGRHRERWDGRCRRCGSLRRSVGDEPTRPSSPSGASSSWRVRLDDDDDDDDDDDVVSALRADVARLERDALRVFQVAPTRFRDPLTDPDVVELVVRRNRERPTRTERLELEQRLDELGRRRSRDNPWRW